MNTEFFMTADMLAKVFWLAAICGTLFFSLRVVLMIVAGEIIDVDGDVDIDVDGDGSFESSDMAFEMFSINTITAFIMMFGWSGLTSYLQFHRPGTISIGIAFAVGVFAMLVTAYMFQLATRLISRGSMFDVKNLVGLNASVYQQIPSDGLGKISVAVPRGGTREIDAVSADKDAIESFQTVKIVKVIDAHTLSVRKI